MARRGRYRYKQPSVKPVVIICIALVLAIGAGIFIWISYTRQLRIDMDRYLESTADQIETGYYETALDDAESALFAAYRLREYEFADLADAYIRLINTLYRGDKFFNEGNYQDALDTYIHAAEMASDIRDLNTELIETKIQTTERFISFYSLIKHADRMIEIAGYDSTVLVYEERMTLYHTIVTIYEDARRVAVTLSFDEGIAIANAGIAEVIEHITKANRTEAMNLLFRGNQQLNDGNLVRAHESYSSALELFQILGDTENIRTTGDKIDYIELLLEGSDDEPLSDDTSQEDESNEDEIVTNYEFNLSINFDLNTLIDNQRHNPANQIRMGSRDGRNEGWYNGCGWVATYNALLLLDVPQHPAEIVKYFEESGGTVLDGVYGTYPNAIEDYIRSFGFNVNRTSFPQLTLNIDNAIKASRVSILTYVHTSAAHYVAIEYRADIDKFIVYNDSFARTRSADLNFSSLVEVGAAIDSVSSLINNTREILFSFSLITVN